MPAVYLRSLPDIRSQDIVLRDTTVSAVVLASGTCSSSSTSRQVLTDVTLYTGRSGPKDVTLRKMSLPPRIHARVLGTSVSVSTARGAARLHIRDGTGTSVAVSSSSGSAKVVRLVRGTSVSVSTAAGAAFLRLRISGTCVASSACTGTATVIPGTPPAPPPAVQSNRINMGGPGASGTWRGESYRPEKDPEPFPMSGKRQKLGFKPRPMTGFGPKKGRGPFRPLS